MDIISGRAPPLHDRSANPRCNPSMIDSAIQVVAIEVLGRVRAALGCAVNHVHVPGNPQRNNASLDGFSTRRLLRRARSEGQRAMGVAVEVGDRNVPGMTHP